MRSIIVLLLAGCTTTTALHTQDGRPGHAIKCPGDFLDWGSCYAKAGEICGAAGYDLLDKQESKSRVFWSTATDRVMVIACK